MARNLICCFWLAALCAGQTGEVADCMPCRVPIGSGRHKELRFYWETRGHLRTLKGIDASGQILRVEGFDEIGSKETVYFNTPDINFDGVPDLELFLVRGMPNAEAFYWVLDAKTQAYRVVGKYPVLTIDSRRKRIEAYVKQGAAGKTSRTYVYQWRGGKLIRVR